MQSTVNISDSCLLKVAKIFLLIHQRPKLLEWFGNYQYHIHIHLETQNANLLTSRSFAHAITTRQLHNRVDWVLKLSNGCLYVKKMVYNTFRHGRESPRSHRHELEWYSSGSGSGTTKARRKLGGIMSEAFRKTWATLILFLTSCLQIPEAAKFYHAELPGHWHCPR